jgi:hypothetical protein
MYYYYYSTYVYIRSKPSNILLGEATLQLQWLRLRLLNSFAGSGYVSSCSGGWVLAKTFSTP